MTANPDSPHLLAPKIKGRMYFGVAKNDDERQPDAKDKLKEAFAAAKVPAEVEVYSSLHGWCVMDMAKEIVYTHHERWDGLGYPEGLHGEEIPIPGRVVAVVDFLDALVTKRVYRDRLPFEEAVNLIVARRGTHFDPAVVDAFLNISGALQRAVLTEHA